MVRCLALLSDRTGMVRCVALLCGRTGLVRCLGRLDRAASDRAVRIAYLSLRSKRARSVRRDLPPGTAKPTGGGPVCSFWSAQGACPKVYDPEGQPHGSVEGEYTTAICPREHGEDVHEHGSKKSGIYVRKSCFAVN